MSGKREYVEIKPRSREELKATFAGDDEQAICDAMYSAAQHDPDWRWAQGELVRFLSHKSLLIRSTAVEALGEIVFFRGHVDIEAVLPEIHKLGNDPALATYVRKYLEGLKSRITVH
jgi:hypothetical protein